MPSHAGSQGRSSILSSGLPWNKHEDAKLLKLQHDGLTWDDMVSHFSGRSRSAIWNRFGLLSKKQDFPNTRNNKHAREEELDVRSVSARPSKRSRLYSGLVLSCDNVESLCYAIDEQVDEVRTAFSTLEELYSGVSRLHEALTADTEGRFVFISQTLGVALRRLASHLEAMKESEEHFTSGHHEILFNISVPLSRIGRLMRHNKNKIDEATVSYLKSNRASRLSAVVRKTDSSQEAHPADNTVLRRQSGVVNVRDSYDGDSHSPLNDMQPRSSEPDLAMRTTPANIEKQQQQPAFDLVTRAAPKAAALRQLDPDRQTGTPTSERRLNFEEFRARKEEQKKREERIRLMEQQLQDKWDKEREELDRIDRELDEREEALKRALED